MEQLKWQNTQKISLNRILWAEKERKREDIIKDIKDLFRLRKEIDNSTIKDTRNLFILKIKRNNQTQNN